MFRLIEVYIGRGIHLQTCANPTAEVERRLAHAEAESARAIEERDQLAKQLDDFRRQVSLNEWVEVPGQGDGDGSWVGCEGVAEGGTRFACGGCGRGA